MIRLHGTKKLLEKLPLRADGRLPEAPVDDDNESPESLLSGWHGNLLVLQRRQCVLFVHNHSRFPVFLPSLQKADFAQLDYRFADGFLNTLLKTCPDERVMNKASAALGPLLCDAPRDRSVQSTLNRMASELAHYVEHASLRVDEMTGVSASVWLANGPCSAKGRKHFWPVEEMHALLLGAD